MILNIQSIIALLVIAVWIVLAVRHTRKHGVCSCGGSCNGDCAHCNCTHCAADGEKRGK